MKKDSRLNISLLPLNIIWRDVAFNLQKAESLLEYIHPATDLLVLPETFSTGFPSNSNKEDIMTLAEAHQDDTIDWVKRMARKYNIAIAGSYIAKENDNLFNRAFFIEPTGDEYFADKHHLFSMAGEDKIFLNGSDRMRVRFRGWNITMVICYDIRFPVWCRNKENDYDLLLAVANWPQQRIQAWNKLLMARAIENLAYVVGVNCQGEDNNGILYDGSAEVFDFKGNPIGHTSSPFIYASLSFDKLENFRSKFPAWRDADQFKLL